MLLLLLQYLGRNTPLQAANGAEMKALKVFSVSLRWEPGHQSIEYKVCEEEDTEDDLLTNLGGQYARSSVRQGEVVVHLFVDSIKNSSLGGGVGG
jgi:hypothetical protein